MTNKVYRARVSVEAAIMIKTHVEFLSNVSISAARTLYDDFYKRFKKIEKTPFMYPVYTEVSGVRYRKLGFKNYLILYTINEKARIVEIEYVWDARMKNKIQ